MPKVAYVCNKYKSYSIRNLYFQNGLYETEDPEEQKLIESSDGFGVYIFYQDPPPQREPEDNSPLTQGQAPPGDSWPADASNISPEEIEEFRKLYPSEEEFKNFLIEHLGAETAAKILEPQPSASVNEMNEPQKKKGKK